MLLKPSMIIRSNNATEQVEKTARPRRAEAKGRSYSEETITPEIALTVPVVLAIITIMAQDLASIPLILYARRGRGKYRAYDNPYYKLIHDRPNPEMTSMNFRELIGGHLIGWGNFFAQQILDNAGTVSELWPLNPGKMTVERFQGERIYKYQTPEGKTRIFLREEIFHVPGFGFDGLIGYSRIALARNAIGLSISAEKFDSKLFSNGLNAGLIYEHPGELSDEAYDNLNESLDEKSGVDKSHLPLILEEGMKIERIGISPKDAQFIESRKFQMSEINRMLGPLPPHMFGDVSGSTSWGTGIDSQEQGYINHTLRPYGVRIEQNLDQQILPQAERDAGMFFEHLFDAFLRGDIATRFEAYVKGITNGFISRNEVRARENLNPVKGGDVMLIPANMVEVAGDNTAADTTASNALEPLWRDAASRAVKRETNDLLGASNRWLMHGQKEPFDEWAAKFYGQDHPAFMLKQFQPLLEAGRNLLGIDLTSPLESFITQALDDRHQRVSFMSAQEITTGAEAYRTETVEKIMSFVATLNPKSAVLEKELYLEEEFFDD
jgi:HK97 family phage portal protein